MIVDDNPANLRLLLELLHQEGYRVLAFTNGRQALRGAAADPPDVILLDIRMPEMDGFEVCRRLKAHATLRDIPVLFISVLSDTEDKVRAFAAGGADYVTQPFQPEEVRARVQAHLQIRRQAAALLQASETRYRTLFEAALNPVLIADDTGCYVDANPAALAFLECSRQDLIGKSVWNFAPPALLSRLQAEHSPFVESRTLETPYLVNGAIKTLLLNVVSINQGGRTLLYGIGQDITARKQAEDALRDHQALLEERVTERTRQLQAEVDKVRVAHAALEESAALHRFLTSNSVDMISRHAPDGTIQYVTPSVVALTGYTPGELVGQSVESIIPPEDMPSIWEVIHQASPHQNQYRVEHRIIRKDGAVIWVETMGRLIHDASGQMSEIQCNVRDVTARKQAEQQLQHSEYRYRAIVEHIPVGVAVVDRRRRVVSINSRLQEWFPDLGSGDVPPFSQASSRITTVSGLDGCLCAAVLADKQIHNSVKRVAETRGVRFFQVVVSPILSSTRDSEQVLQIVEDITVRTLEEEALRQRLQEAEARLSVGHKNRLHDLHGASSAMQTVYRQIQRAAQNQRIVLLAGETGTGKELAARALHKIRGRGRFVAVNCANIALPLLESELYGHQKGAFTGAVASRPGFFEAAGEGVLLLDEFASAPQQLQTALLRVLDTRQVTRVGATTSIPVPAKIVVASNQEPEELLEKGLCREDLFYRLCEMVIKFPPLRHRLDDIPLLAELFLKEAGTISQQQLRHLSPRSLERLCQYHWPGNVRQLRSLMHTLAESVPATTIRPADLPDWLSEQARPVPTLEQRTRKALEEALTLAPGNKAEAARMLGITRKTLYALLRKHGINAAEFPDRCLREVP